MIVRMLSAAALTLFLAAQQNIAQYSIKLPDREVSVEYKDGDAVFSGAAVSGKPGQPKLPGYKVTFLLPDGVNPADVTISLENLSEETVRGTFNVSPALPPVTGETIIWPTGKNIIDGKDTDVYGKNEFFPAKYCGAPTFGKMRQYQLVDVIIRPFRYNPLSGELKHITGGTLQLNFPHKAAVLRKSFTSNKQNKVKKQVGSVEKYLKEKAVNPEVIESYEDVSVGTLSIGSGTASVATLYVPPDAARTVNNGDGYVVITTTAIVNTSQELQTYIYHKSLQGYDVRLVLETTWGGGTGDAAAENIRGWLKNNYLSDNIRYVLLIGNPHPEYGDVPMKMSEPKYNNTNEAPELRVAPTDFYYAELSGDWDINNDGHYGVDGDDFGQPGGPDIYAEVAVGRIPVYNTTTDLDKILRKTIAYENAESRGWRKSVLLPMVPLTATDPSYKLGEAIRNDYLLSGNWKSFRIYNSHNKYTNHKVIGGVVNLTPAVEHAPCRYEHVERIWKGNRFGLVTWQTHGDSLYAQDVLDNHQAEELNDAVPSMTFQASCLTSRPTNENNLSYSLLKNGAVATVGATNVSSAYAGISSEGYANNGTNGGFAYNYTRFLTMEKMSTAEALNAAKATVDNNLMWMNHLVFNLYGCPDLVLDIDDNAPSECVVEAEAKYNHITWTDNANDGNLYKAGHYIYRATGNDDFVRFKSVSSYSTSYDDYDVQPGTKYYYRVRTYFYPEGQTDYSNIDSTTTHGNFALGKTAYSSSTANGYSRRYAVDDNTSTRWMSGTPGSGQYFEVDLGSEYNLSGCEIVFDRAGTPGNCYSYSISVSGNYPDVANPPPQEARIQACGFDAKGRYVTIHFFATPDNGPAGICEFRIFGQSVPESPEWNTPVFDDESEQVELSWKASTGATTYSLFQSQPGQPRFAIATDLTGTAYTTTGLIKGKEYTFTLVAGNAAGHSSLTGQSIDVTTPADPPLQPVYFNVAHNQYIPGVTLSWEPDGNYTEGVEIQRRRMNTTQWTVLGKVPLPAKKYMDAAISTSEYYEYRIRAYNKSSYSPYTEIINTRIAPPAVFGLDGTFDRNTSTLTLQWMYASSTHSGFRVERTDIGGSLITEVVAETGPDVTSFSHIVENNHNYQYYVYAFNNFGSTGSERVNLATRPAAPSNLSAEVTSPTELTLSWIDNAYTNFGIPLGAIIEQAIGNGAFVQIGNIIQPRQYSVASLAPSTTYRYRICVFFESPVSGYQQSGYSNVVTVTTPPAASSNLSLNGTVTAQSANASYPAANAIDGNVSTRWKASSKTNPQWLKIDLGSVKTINSIQLLFNYSGYTGDCYDFKVETSANNSSWSTRINMPDNTNTSRDQSYAMEATARFVRISIMDTPGLSSSTISEFRVFGR